MKLHVIPISSGQLAQVERMLGMAERFAPEQVEDATVYITREDDLTTEEIDAGVAAVFYIDESTYKMARQYGAPASIEVIDKIPSKSESYFDD